MKSFRIDQARDGGFVILHLSVREMITEFLFAGTFDECVSYLGNQFAINEPHPRPETLCQALSEDQIREQEIMAGLAQKQQFKPRW